LGLRVVELLLPVSDAKIKNNDGYTALMYAAKFGYKKMVELLLPESDAEASNIYEETVLDVAKSNGYDQIVQLLQRHIGQI